MPSDSVPPSPSPAESLRELAERATPGPWEQGEKLERSGWDHRRFVYCDDATGGRVADCSTAGAFIDDATRIANAAYIAAANPAAIIPILDELSAAKSVIAELVKLAKAHDWSPHAPLTAYFQQVCDELAASREALREAQQDTKRLDWLDTKHWDAIDRATNATEYRQWDVQGQCLTVRAAIDAAAGSRS
jgi:hypothetical protein